MIENELIITPLRGYPDYNLKFSTSADGIKWPDFSSINNQQQRKDFLFMFTIFYINELLDDGWRWAEFLSKVPAEYATDGSQMITADFEYAVAETIGLSFVPPSRTREDGYPRLKRSEAIEWCYQIKSNKEERLWRLVRERIDRPPGKHGVSRYTPYKVAMLSAMLDLASLIEEKIWKPLKKWTGMPTSRDAAVEFFLFVQEVSDDDEFRAAVRSALADFRPDRVKSS